MICENCEVEQDGSFGSGRFCSRKCSAGFSTKAKRADINARVSEKLTGTSLSTDAKAKLKIAWADGRYKNNGRKRTAIENIATLKNTAVIKALLFESGEKEEVCEECSISSWNGRKVCLELHHLNGNNKDNRLENLQILCPNCHSQTDNYAGRGKNARVNPAATNRE